MEKIVVTGGTGQLGSDLVRILDDYYQVASVNSANFDIANVEATVGFIKSAKPNAVIHAAAFTDVDGCETNPDKAFRINGLGTRNVAIAAAEIKAKLFYISTDYVFDGTKDGASSELDTSNPATVYGKSKLLGEEFVKQHVHQHFIIRIAWLYGKEGKNFVKTMLKLAQEKEELQVVNDQRGTPTWTVDVANQIKKLLTTRRYGTYHCTSQGSCTWYEFALEIFKCAGYVAKVGPSGSVHLIPSTQDLKPIKLRPVSSEEFLRPARRPKNSVLENYMLKLQGLDIMPQWEHSLAKFVKAIDSQRSTVNSQQPKG